MLVSFLPSSLFLFKPYETKGVGAGNVTLPILQVNCGTERSSEWPWVTQLCMLRLQPWSDALCCIFLGQGEGC